MSEPRQVMTGTLGQNSKPPFRCQTGLTIQKIPKEQAACFPLSGMQHHYSKLPGLSMSKIVSLGFYMGGELAGVNTLGWGTPAAPDNPQGVSMP